MGADVPKVRPCVVVLCIYFIHFPEPSVRAELMEQVPHIAMYCHQYPEYLHQAVPSHLLPLVVTFLTDTNNQVRKTSQAALLVLLEQGLVDAEDVEDQVGISKECSSSLRSTLSVLNVPFCAEFYLAASQPTLPT